MQLQRGKMTDMHEEDLRTKLARERNELAHNRTSLANRRTRLANRRTFLAWCRTALAFMTFGFLLEKVDTFLLSNHATISAAVVSELAMLGKFAFMGGPVLMFFAGWRYFQLERELGFERGELFIFPEMLLFGVILGSAVIYVFL